MADNLSQSETNPKTRSGKKGSKNQSGMDSKQAQIGPQSTNDAIAPNTPGRRTTATENTQTPAGKTQSSQVTVSVTGAPVSQSKSALSIEQTTWSQANGEKAGAMITNPLPENQNVHAKSAVKSKSKAFSRCKANDERTIEAQRTSWHTSSKATKPEEERANSKMTPHSTSSKEDDPDSDHRSGGQADGASQTSTSAQAYNLPRTSIMHPNIPPPKPVDNVGHILNNIQCSTQYPGLNKAIEELTASAANIQRTFDQARVHLNIAEEPELEESIIQLKGVFSEYLSRAQASAITSRACALSLFLVQAKVLLENRNSPNLNTIEALRLLAKTTNPITASHINFKSLLDKLDVAIETIRLKFGNIAVDQAFNRVDEKTEMVKRDFVPTVGAALRSLGVNENSPSFGIYASLAPVLFLQFLIRCFNSSRISIHNPYTLLTSRLRLGRVRRTIGDSQTTSRRAVEHLSRDVADIQIKSQRALQALRTVTINEQELEPQLEFNLREALFDLRSLRLEIAEIGPKLTVFGQTHTSVVNEINIFMAMWDNQEKKQEALNNLSYSVLLYTQLSAAIDSFAVA